MMRMVDEQKKWFEVVKHKSGLPPEVLATVLGIGAAELKVERLDALLNPAERQDGWGHYHRPGERPAGVDLRKRGTGKVRRNSR
jgi:hypothetical protein